MPGEAVFNLELSPPERIQDQIQESQAEAHAWVRRTTIGNLMAQGYSAEKASRLIDCFEAIDRQAHDE
jgi:hypothetical protein